MSDRAKHVVVYTDGGARPNPGFIGSGLHGYCYRLNEVSEKSKFAVQANKFLITDQGYLLAKDAEQKAAQPVTVETFFDSYVPSMNQGTNNFAELKAAIFFFTDILPTLGDIQSIRLITDSEIVVKGMTERIDTWIQRGWVNSSGKPIEHQLYWDRLLSMVNTFGRERVKFEWIKGHDDAYGNVRSDYMATIGIASSRDRNESPVTLFESPKEMKALEEFSPFLCMKRVYFNTHSSYNTPGLYYQTTYQGNDFILGKRVGDSAFSVTKLHTPQPLLQLVIEEQGRHPQSHNSLVYLRLDRLKEPDVRYYIDRYKQYALDHDPRGHGLLFLDKKPLTQKVRAGELPLRAVDVLNHLEELLEAYQADQIGSKANHSLIDITDLFFELSTKKIRKEEVIIQTLRKEIGSGVASLLIEETITIQGKTYPMSLPLIFGSDLPTRNALKRLETENPRIQLVTWAVSPCAINYACIVESQSGVGIWSNYFSNTVYFLNKGGS